MENTNKRILITGKALQKALKQYSRLKPIDFSGTKKPKRELVKTAVSIDTIYKIAEVDLENGG